MLSGPAIIRISVLLLLAGALAALVQYLLPGSTQAPPPPSATVPAPSAPAIRKIAPAPPPSRPEEAPAPVVVQSAPAAPPAPSATVQAEPAPEQVPSEALAFPAPPPSAAPQGEAEIATAERTEGAPAIALVDLNTASVAELNRLRGGGNIGRAIIAKRPYAQVSDLLTKRVLSRAVYDRIREQVTVR